MTTGESVGLAGFGGGGGVSHAHVGDESLGDSEVQRAGEETSLAALRISRVAGQNVLDGGVELLETVLSEAVSVVEDSDHSSGESTGAGLSLVEGGGGAVHVFLVEVVFDGDIDISGSGALLDGSRVGETVSEELLGFRESHALEEVVKFGLVSSGIFVDGSDELVLKDRGGGKVSSDFHELGDDDEGDESSENGESDLVGVAVPDALLALGADGLDQTLFSLVSLFVDELGLSSTLGIELGLSIARLFSHLFEGGLVELLSLFA